MIALISARQEPQLVPAFEHAADVLDARAAGRNRGGDLVDADAEAGADRRAGIGPRGAGPPGDDRKRSRWP